MVTSPLLCEHGLTVDLLYEECATDRRLRHLVLDADLTGRCPKCGARLVEKAAASLMA